MFSVVGPTSGCIRVENRRIALGRGCFSDLKCAILLRGIRSYKRNTEKTTVLPEIKTVLHPSHTLKIPIATVLSRNSPPPAGRSRIYNSFLYFHHNVSSFITRDGLISQMEQSCLAWRMVNSFSSIQLLFMQSLRSGYTQLLLIGEWEKVTLFSSSSISNRFSFQSSFAFTYLLFFLLSLVPLQKNHGLQFILPFLIWLFNIKKVNVFSLMWYIRQLLSHILFCLRLQKIYE